MLLGPARERCRDRPRRLRLAQALRTEGCVRRLCPGTRLPSARVADGPGIDSQAVNASNDDALHVRVPTGTAILDYLVELFMALTPHDPLSNKIKAALMRARGAQVGARPKIWRDVWIDDYRKLSLGDDV